MTSINIPISDDSKEYWINELIDAPRLVQIPTDFNRSQNQVNKEKNLSFAIEPDLLNKLGLLANNLNTDLGTTLLAAFGVLLYRYASQDEIVVGFSIGSLKNDLSVKNSNYSTGNLPIWFGFHDEISFRDILGMVKAKVNLAEENQQTFDEQTILKLTGKKTVDLTLLFNVIFKFNEKTNEKVTPLGISGFDLALSVQESDNSLDCNFKYNHSLFAEQTVERFSGHYTTLLEAITEKIDLPVLSLPILTEKEKNQILNEWNNTVTGYPSGKCIHDLFEEQVKKTPDSIAVEFENMQMTYAQLNSAANKMANFLVKHGASEDQNIALFVERGFDMIIGLLAISKTGATYLPLDPIYPKARLFLIVDDAKPIIFLTQKSLSGSIPETNSKIVYFDDLDNYNNENPNNATWGCSQKPAYILYTSGSTGKPKGVPITQHAVVNLVNSMTKLLRFTAQDILVAVTTISFDIAELEMYMPLFIGAKLVIATQETATDMDLLAEKIEKSNATVFQATPVTFKMLKILHWKGKKDLKLIIGGEALSKELVRYLLPRCSEIFNSYGPTETAIYSVVKNLTFEDAQGEGYVPIGRPIDNTTLYALNKKLVPVPIGIPGELYIGGDGLSSGYINLPGKTDERFMINPFGKGPEEKIYKTGDLVQYFPDGNLVFLNRLDSQVKIRGFRIELGEIESAIAQHTTIKDNVVIVREDIPGDKKLVAYFIEKENQQTDLGELRQFLLTLVPDYMVPVFFVKMDAFPVTLNGKVDRNKLPVPEVNANQSTTTYVAPVTETEKKLATIWSEVLKIDRIGLLDNFFELGGNSLNGALMIFRIKKTFRKHLPLQILFNLQTMAEISQEIDSQKPSINKTDSLQTIPRIKGNQTIFPVSPGQKRLWFVENFEPGNLAYNMPFDYLIKGEMDVTVLENSINYLIIRHESFRTVILTQNGETIQQVLSPIPFKLKVENLEELTDEGKKRELEKYSSENEKHLFHLASYPLFIIKLIRINPTEWVLLFNIHHCITDGLSVQIFLEELGHVYTALKQQQPVNLPPQPIAYSDFAEWQNEWLQGTECKKQLDYWVNELKGAPDILQLPSDFQRPLNQTYEGDEINITIDKKTTAQLHLFSQKNHASLFVTLLSVFNVLISRYTTQEEFLIGIPVSGRKYQEQESVCGIFINNFPLRITPLENMTFSQMFEMCKRKFFQAFDNQELPIDRIVEELKVKRTANISPLFQVMFNLLNMFDEEIQLADSKMEMVDKRRHIAQFDLSLHIFETKKTLNCVFEYNTNLFKRSRIERMAGHFNELVKSLIQNPEQKIRKVPILTENEKKVVLGEWNATTVEFPENKCIYQIFEEQVARTPDSVAIYDEKRKVTYSELNRKANKLARHLHGSGAVEGSLVGICIERGTDLLVALLAVQKAGCTYIPLDPIYPKDRLALILEDGNPVAMLTERKLLDNLPETPAKNIFIEEVGTYENESDGNTSYTVTPETVAYLIYTSGSTGKPKGVQIQQRALVNFICSMAKKPGITPKDIMLAVTTISFDIAGLELYLPILYGATIAIATQETSMNPELLIKKIEDSKATILQATPVTFRMLNSAEWKGAKGLKILCGGEAMPKELAYDLIRKCGELWNMYGPTETTVWSTVEKVEVDENDKTGYINLGKPIDNTFIYVLNTEFQPVPIGYPGELFIGGDGLAKGYFNLPAMTNDKFLPDPFSGIPGSRMYRTGDLVQQTEAGKLEFLNRVDSQVKIRGFRIELGEIESALAQYPSTTDSVVIVREDTPGDKKLVAYIVKKEKLETDIPELRVYLKTKIPDYMVPSAFVFIDKFPLTPNGKIDRKALPSPQEASPQEVKAYLEPQTDLEKKIAGIWCEVLKNKRIGIDENFFEIGGHSMLAVTLMVKVEKEIGIRLPLASLFDHGTIQEMAKLLEKESDSIKWSSLVPIRSKGKKRPLYLVHGAGLNLLLYTTIVSHLDPEQPVFGLQAKGLDGVDEPIDTIEGIAAYYNSEIMAVDDSGSYALAGFSMGGQLAYEMARQLVEAGKTVSFLGVFDTVSDNASDMHIPIVKRYYLRMDRLIRQISWVTAKIINTPSNEKMEFFKLKWNSLIKRFTKDDYKIQPVGVSLGNQSELPKFLHNVHRANWIALEKYVLPPYPGKLTLFRAMHQTFYIQDPVNYGWDKFVKELVILHIPGEHSTIFAPSYDNIFAQALQKALDERE